MGTQETKVYIAILIAAAVLGVIVIYFIITILRQQKSNFILYHAKIQAEIITLEKERGRMAKDLHDDLAPVLMALRYNFNSFELTDPEDFKTVERSNESIDVLITRVREIANDLLPEVLLRRGLVTTLEEAANKVFAKTGLELSFTHTNIPALPEDKSVNIYRIIQEVIHNTIKHAGATSLLINLRCNGQLIVVETRDDGCGFDDAAVLKELKGLGLRSLLSRADILKGTMFLDSKAGEGTHYIFEIPI